MNIPDLTGTGCRAVILSTKHEVWCLVDEQDYGWLTEVTWNISWGSRTRWQLYAKRNVGVERATIRMHREIMKRADPRSEEFMRKHHVDHGNRQSLDNRRANLCWATPAANARNSGDQATIPSLALIVMRLRAQSAVVRPLRVAGSAAAPF